MVNTIHKNKKTFINGGLFYFVYIKKSCILIISNILDYERFNNSGTIVQ